VCSHNRSSTAKLFQILFLSIVSAYPTYYHAVLLDSETCATYPGGWACRVQKKSHNRSATDGANGFNLHASRRTSTPMHCHLPCITHILQNSRTHCRKKLSLPLLHPANPPNQVNGCIQATAGGPTELTADPTLPAAPTHCLQLPHTV
jgi:hypothetical protein